ncbi:hypothetical protein CL644_02805 [bacterium]|nr:hypothetical protein [Parcubacteria group bacterium]MBF05611.1 hypothetical protein [bacterium]
MPDRDKKLDEIYKLVRSNNKMLRRMKRNAFLGTILKIVLYAILLGVPVYLYFTIFQPILAEVLNAYTQIQATGAQMQDVGNQIQGVTDAIPLNELQGLLNVIPGVDFSGTPQ